MKLYIFPVAEPEMYRFACLLIVCASALAYEVGSDGASAPAIKPPQYNKCLKSLRKAEQVLATHQTNKKMPVTHSERHYAMMLGVLQYAAKLASNTKKPVNYDEVYLTAVDREVPHAWSDPVNVTKIIKEELSLLLARTNDIRDLIDSVCNDKSKVRTSDCNYLVDLIVKEHSKRYNTAAKIVLTLGPLSDFYLNSNAAFERAAKNHSIVPLLLSGYKKEFVNVLPKLTDVYNLLHLHS
ncbi:uncharacterized protein LOC116413643 [Galleria mellonella]|uniref:Uncharacterized protein LOC116413643 n=1 Tax=Galleria mellonella TaxID=7137 RepID=A0A6J3CDH6_GALME|nr:uncharacterized protein LOC116413643 [Galleria mellonella]